MSKCVPIPLLVMMLIYHSLYFIIFMQISIVMLMSQ